MPFPFYTVSYMPTHMPVSNFDVKSQTKSSASTMLEMLAKAEKAESNLVPLVPSLADRIIPDNTRRSLLSVTAWAKEIPVFTQLPTKDQIELIKTTWSEINTLKLVYQVASCPLRSNTNFQSDDLAHLYLTDSQITASFIQQTIKECVALVVNACFDKNEFSYLKLITLMNPCK